MSDTPVRSGVQITFSVIDHDDSRAIAVAAANSREVPNLRDRVFVSTTFLALRSDGKTATYRESEQQHLDSTNYENLNENALLTALKLIHDVDRAREGLA